MKSLFDKNFHEIENTYHRTQGSSRPDANTWSSLLKDLSCSKREWPRSVGTMDMWWLFWTMLCSLPFGSENILKLELHPQVSVKLAKAKVCVKAK